MKTSIFLTGPAGSGKTTQGIERLMTLLNDGVSPHNILVLVPQRTLGSTYETALMQAGEALSGQVDIVTMDGLALRSLNLLWPQVAKPAGFAHPNRPPIFLTIETVQYYMAEVIEPFLQDGYFDPNVVSVTITLPRLMSQILDNLEKAALIGLPHTEVGDRLKTALGGEISSRVAFDHAQTCVNAFREFCLRNNLLDFSLRVESFRDHIWANDELQAMLVDRYRHIIVDNLEEQNPFVHNILSAWLPQTESTLLIFDEEAGYRIFLGANWRTAEALKAQCDVTESLTEVHTSSPAIKSLAHHIGISLGVESAEDEKLPQDDAENIDEDPGDTDEATDDDAKTPDPRDAFSFLQTRFHPQMLTWAVDQIEQLVKDEGVSPNEIVVLSPFVSDALRFSFMNAMERRGLPARSHRPSRALKEEPAAVATLTLARLIYPHWNMLPEPFDVMQALGLTIGGLDLVRARLLVDVLYRPHDKTGGPLYPFEEIEGDVRERITYQLGQRFDELRAWILAERNAEPAPLDHVFSRLFGEILSQPGFGFHDSQEAGEVVANLIESVKKFRRVTARVPRIVPQAGPHSGERFGQVEGELPGTDFLNRAYVRMIEQGVVAALYTRSWDPSPEEAVLIAPAYTYLMSNRPVDYQIWLDAGSHGWWERIAQPLTHPYVLAADWESDQTWTDEHEVKNQIDRMYRLILGLTRRCRKRIFIGNSEISEQGYEQRGRLLLALQQTLRRLERAAAENKDGA